MSSNIEAFARRLTLASVATAGAARLAVDAAALAVTTAIRAEMTKAGVRGGQMRGVGRSGAKVSVGYDVKGRDHPAALVRARGPLHLLERDTQAHDIAPRRAKALAAPYLGADEYVMSASHPGTHGKHPFERGKKIGEPLMTAAAQKAVREAIIKVFA